MSDKGLEGVVAAHTALSRVDGEGGRLVYAGYEIDDLAGHVSFEEVCHLLWHGDLPTGAQLDDLRTRLSAALSVPTPVLQMLRLVPRDAHPMSALAAAVAMLGGFEPTEPATEAANDRKALELTARTFTLTAAIDRLRQGLDPVPPDPERGLADNFLYMLRGQPATSSQAHVLDVALILHAEHGMNASTFAARVAAGTLTDMHAAVVAAIATLKGPLHGGANERVMRMLREIDRPERAASWIGDALERGERVMGFGHRVYRVLDPRAPILRALARDLTDGAGDTRWLEVSEAVREAMATEMERRGKKIYPNVDFFSASVYHTLGIPGDLFTNVFACARMAGWTAHIIEQQRDNRLIRPRGQYIGPKSRRVRPISERG